MDSRCFHLQEFGTFTKINYGKRIISGDTIRIGGIKDEIFGLSLDMKLDRQSDNYMVRIVMEDDKGKIYLVAEDYPMLGNAIKGNYVDYCEETVLLWKVRPKELRIYNYGAEVILGSINIISSLRDSSLTASAVSDTIRDLRASQAKVKRDALNESIKQNKKLWFADITALCLLPFEDRIRIIGGTDNTLINGIEFYAGGIFDMSGIDTNKEKTLAQRIETEDTCVSAFSWRNRHGKDWLTPVKDQGLSGYCSVFTAISCVEAVANLYFNKKIDMDLSEQEAAVCNGAYDPWNHGMSLSSPLLYIKNYGVCEESAYPFVNDSTGCESDIISPTENVRINNYQYVSSDEQAIKKALIKYGPLASGFTRYDHTVPPDSMPSNHAMALYGYDVIQSGDTIFHIWNYNKNDHGLVPAFIVEEDSPFIGRTVWKFKNSYVNSDPITPPYMFITFDKVQHMVGCISLITPITSLLYDENDIVWEDADGDGFYNWGIGDKPSSCPSWVPDQRDGDDSNPTIGPIDVYGFTTDANPEDNPIIYINSDTSSSSSASYCNNVIVQNNSTWTLGHDHHFHYGAWINVKSGSKLVINGSTLVSARLILEPGSKLVISNGGKLVTPVTAKFSAPLGVIVDVTNGIIM